MNYIITDHLQVEESRLASMSAEELIACATEARDVLTTDKAQAYIDSAKNAIEERKKTETESPKRHHHKNA